jgi:hypothetical protein
MHLLFIVDPHHSSHHTLVQIIHIMYVYSDHRVKNDIQNLKAFSLELEQDAIDFAKKYSENCKTLLSVKETEIPFMMWIFLSQ